MGCPELDVLCFLNYSKSGWCYVSGDFESSKANLKILHICKKSAHSLGIMFISQVVALFLEIKDFKNLHPHIFHPLHNVFLRHM